MKKVLAMVLVLIMAFSCTAFASAENEKFQVAVILKDLSTIYDSWLAAAAEVEVANYDDIEIKVYDAAFDDATCVNLVENAVLQDVDLIIIQKTSNFNTDDLFQSVVNDDGIPIVTVNVPVDDGVAYNIPAPNHALGLAQGKLAAELLPENAKILIVRGKTVDVEQERYDGLIEGMSSRDDITILAEEHAFYDQAKAMALMEDWLQIYDDFDGVMCLSDGMALGVVQACNGYDANYDFSSVQIYSIDGLPDSCLQIDAGTLVCTIQQSADVMMHEAFELAHKILTGEVTERFDVEIETVTITKDNVGQYLDQFREAGYIS